MYSAFTARPVPRHIMEGNDMKSKNGSDSKRDAANALRWKRGESGHYEVYYLTFNHLPTSSGFWVRYTMTAPADGNGEHYAQIWFSYFNYLDPTRNFALKRRFPIASLESAASPFKVTIANNILTGRSAVGAISGDGHEVTWDLSFRSEADVFNFLPEFFYKKELADTLAVCPRIDAKFFGNISIDGERLLFNGDPGCQTHLWGESHADRWAWAHCNSFRESGEAYFEALAVQVKRFGLTVPLLHFAGFGYDGKRYPFTEIPGMLATRGDFALGKWKFRATALDTKFEVELTCRTQDLISAEYFDPTGRHVFCNNTECADATVRVFRRKTPLHPWKADSTLTAPGTCHIEFASDDREGRVDREIIEV